jgi:ABC-type Fe3+/spermidine/putrescine transport system ATPase subunit
MNAIEFDRVVKNYDRRRIVDQVDLTVEDGEFIVIVGASGSGKTTLLRLIAGLEQADGGRISLGREIVDEPVHHRWTAPDRRRVGMVFQDFALWPHLTCRENVTTVMRGSRHMVNAEAERLLAAFGIRRFADVRPHKLSGGEQQRVGLARAMASQPRILLLDEPFSNLDVETRDALRLETRSVADRLNATVVLVTHDPTDAARLADRIAVLEDGRVMQVATPEAVFREPATAWTARFVGAIGGFRAELTFEEGALGVRCGRVRLPVAQRYASLLGKSKTRSVIVYVRPEAVQRGDGADTFEASVLHASYSGEHYLVYWSVAGLGVTLCTLEKSKPGREHGRLRLSSSLFMIFADPLEANGEVS